ncbi:hypothetical protein [Microbispora sp. ATCC PTA-5024]|uniref:hypothetical protein n=1 Tax=Microbispora sp. ATCC PTA-5024 TaxID=316330 RepID=UPI0003DDC1EF|nr:hypothetical protein [Microbispora sp. ATCC PTA-5024]ETK34177.1 hypothetical protein MPTA5024_20730 [Microbispora sp. ATCC PTA-5024]
MISGPNPPVTMESHDVSPTRREALLTLTGSALLLSGCGLIDRPPKTMSATEMVPLVKQMAARRTAALKSGDVAAWLKDVDTANAALLKHERMVFANFRKFDFETLKLVEYGGAPLYAKPMTFRKDLPQKTVAFAMRLMTRLRGVDRATSAGQYFYVFEIVDDKSLRLIDVGPDKEGSDVVYDCPWDLTPLRVQRTGDVILATDGSVHDFESYVRVAAKASRAVRRVWGSNPAPDAFALFLTTRSSSYRRWFGAGTPSWSEGVEISLPESLDSGVSGPAGYAGSRIVVNLSSKLGGGDPYEVMKHEITHAISTAVQTVDTLLKGLNGGEDDGAAVPRWASEGFAGYVETLEAPAKRQTLIQIVKDGMRRGLFRDDLPDNNHFYDDTSRGFNYALGWSIFRYVHLTYGQAKALELYLTIVKKRTLMGFTGSDSLFDALHEIGLEDQPFALPKTSRFWQAWLAAVRDS